MPNIVVIDNDRQFCKLMKKMLELDGYQVTMHQSIKTARIQLNQELPDIICCDLNLLGDSGYDFLANRHEIHGLLDVPFIAVTGDCRPSNQVKAAEQGVFATLIKPFTKSKLSSTIQSALGATSHKPNSSEPPP